MRSPPLILLVVVLALVSPGCGKKGASSNKAEGSGSPGAKIFTDSGCSGCHTLAVAGAKGTMGPNLDELRPNQERVALQVRNGGNGMPSFKNKLSAEQIKQVAAFVATSAGTGRAGKIAFQPNGQKIEDCHGNPACYEQAFGNVAYKKGPKAALDELDRASRTNSIVRRDCHPIAHSIGAGGLLHFEGSVGKAFAAGTATCGAGYYHGLLQWKLAGVKSDKVASVARSACNDPAIKSNAFNYYQCDHGLGHGLMLYTAYDLPQALAFCHQLLTEFDRVSCSGGVFMENQSSSFGLRTKWLSNKNLLYPCNSKIVQRRDKLYCYLLVTSHILPEVGGDWRKTADWCRRSERGWVQYCFQSYGRDVSGTAGRDPAKIRRLCAQAGSGEEECLFGAVRDLLNDNPQNLRARRLCETVKARFRSYCYFGIGSILGTVFPEGGGRTLACQAFAAKDKDLDACLSGAGG